MNGKQIQGYGVLVILLILRSPPSPVEGRRR